MKEDTDRLHRLFVTDIKDILLREGERERETKRGKEREREIEREGRRDGLRATEVSVQCLNKMPSLIECTRP